MSNPFDDFINNLDIPDGDASDLPGGSRDIPLFQVELDCPIVYSTLKKLFEDYDPESKTINLPDLYRQIVRSALALAYHLMAERKAFDFIGIKDREGLFVIASPMAMVQLVETVAATALQAADELRDAEI